MTDFAPPKIPGYELKQELGAGGMATVYLAVQKSLDRKVAIKVMKVPKKEAGAAQDSFKRFAREGRMLARLTHKNVCGIYDIAQFGDTAYIAMEYIEGGTLGDRLRRGMTAAEAIGAVVQLASALAAAHAIGIVHRDLKPANVMMRGKVPVLTDFGIARDLSPDRTEITGDMILGTPHYMSPEQIEGKPIDGRSDIYSLGAMFYELLVGQQPYQGDSMISVCMQHLQAPIPELPDSFAELQPVIDTMMAKDRDERYPDMAAVVVALRQAVMDSPSLRQALQFDLSTPLSEQMRELGFSFEGPEAAPIREALQKSATLPPSGTAAVKRAPRSRAATDPVSARAARTAVPPPPLPWWRRHQRALAVAVAVLALGLATWRFLGEEKLSEEQVLAVQMLSRQFDRQIEAGQLARPSEDSAVGSLRALYAISRSHPQVRERQGALRAAVERQVDALAADARFGEARALLADSAAVFESAEVQSRMTALDAAQANAMRDVEIARRRAEIAALLDLPGGIDDERMEEGLAQLAALAGPEHAQYRDIAGEVAASLSTALAEAIEARDFQAAVAARDRLRLLLPGSPESDAAYTAVDRFAARQSAEQVLQSTRTALAEREITPANIEQILAGLGVVERSEFRDSVAEIRAALLRRAQDGGSRALDSGDLALARAIINPVLSRLSGEPALDALEARLRMAEQSLAERQRAEEEAQRAGRLALDAAPFAEVLSVVGPDGQELPLQGLRTTPFVMTVPEGRYRVTMLGPDGQSRQVADATVNRGQVTVSELRFASLDVDDYLREAGYR